MITVQNAVITRCDYQADRVYDGRRGANLWVLFEIRDMRRKWNDEDQRYDEVEFASKASFSKSGKDAEMAYNQLVQQARREGLSDCVGMTISFTGSLYATTSTAKDGSKVFVNIKFLYVEMEGAPPASQPARTVPQPAAPQPDARAVRPAPAPTRPTPQPVAAVAEIDWSALD